jgi:hypothetical protein
MQELSKRKAPGIAARVIPGAAISLGSLYVYLLSIRPHIRPAPPGERRYFAH